MYQTAQQVGNVSMAAGQAIANAKQQPELMEYMDKLGLAIGYGEELASQLQARLSGVLSPPSPCPDSCGKNPGPVSFYGQQVGAAIDRIAGINESMRNMLDRLQA